MKPTRSHFPENALSSPGAGANLNPYALGRRRFVKLTGGALALGLIGRAGASVLAKSSLFSSSGNGRVLVVIHLKGGNDGLNTVVPWASDDYRHARPTLALGAEEVLKIDDGVWLHAAAQPLASLYRDGHLAIVNDVGCARPSLSHFRASEIWHTASGPGEILASGWLARTQFALGSGPAWAFDAPTDDASFARMRPSAWSLGDADELSRFGLAPSPLSARIDREKFTDQTNFGATLQQIAETLPARRGSQIVHITLDGFDTHFEQRARHAALLSACAQGLASFHHTLERLGVSERVLALTYSEFGRTAAENAAAGTDHGTTGPVFVTGSPVKGGFFGPRPWFDLASPTVTAPAIDFRRVYATVIERWLGTNAERALGSSFEAIDFLRAV
jgi:uncharacterized protein (DUF1501 family)